MCGGGLSYDVLVEMADVPEQMRPDGNGNTHTQIWRDGGKYFHFADATQPADDRAMPQGWQRYDRWRQHELAARAIALDIARRVFPELKRYRGDVLPTLWVTGLLTEETSARRVFKGMPAYAQIAPDGRQVLDGRSV